MLLRQVSKEVAQVVAITQIREPTNAQVYHTEQRGNFLSEKMEETFRPAADFHPYRIKDVPPLWVV